MNSKGEVGDDGEQRARYQKARELFDRARDLTEPERSEFLIEAASEDAKLLDEVHSLLAWSEESHGLEEPVLGKSFSIPSAAELVASDSNEPSQQGPSLIGSYRVSKRLDSGATGTVFLAEQSVTRREVAIKLLRSDATGMGTIRRFELEAEVLGRMDHANIAQVHEAGVTVVDGCERMFLVMEWIDGSPITAHCRDKNLSVSQRIELLAQVCDGLQHAHQRRIVHRDLKPDNVLVDAQGCAKVLDFGIAHVLDGSVREEERGLLVGTPRYMSPEQFAGNLDGIDTRTDVYSLGVLGYEMLAEQPAYDVSGLLPDQVGQVVRSAVPTPLGKLSSRLGGDLERVVSKALSKSREERYESASAMANDLRRILAHEPISARPRTMGYALGCFVRRRKALATSLAALGILSLVGGASVLWSGWRARSEAAKNRILSDFIFDFISTPDPVRYGRDVRVIDLLEGLDERLEQELGDWPEAEVEVRTVLGRLQRRLGNFEEAQQCQRKGIELALAELGETNPLTVAAALEFSVLLVVQVKGSGAYAEARPLLDLVIAHTKLDQPEGGALLAEAYRLLARLEAAEKRVDLVDGHIATALKLADEHLNRTDAITVMCKRDQITRLTSHGEHLAAMGRARGLVADCQADLEPNHRLTLLAQFTLGCTLSRVCKASEQPNQQLLHEALRILEDVAAGRANILGSNRRGTLGARLQAVWVLEQLGRLEEAHSRLVRILIDTRESQGADSWVTKDTQARKQAFEERAEAAGFALDLKYLEAK